MSESEQQTSTPTTGGESSADQPNVKKKKTMILILKPLKQRIQAIFPPVAVTTSVQKYEDPSRAATISLLNRLISLLCS